MEQTKSQDNFVTNDLEIMRHAVNYNQWISGLCLPYIGETVFEIGGGIGNLSNQILKVDNVKRLVSMELEEDCYLECLQKVKSLHPNERFEPRLGDFLSSHEIHETFDTVVCFNVLEHLKDVDLALEKVNTLLNPGGRFIVYVPAFECIRGAIDEELEHVQRFTRKSASELLKRHGFRILKMRYFNTVGFFGWWLNFKVLKRRNQNLKQVLFYDRFIFPVQRILEKNTPWQPIGQSLFFVAEK